MAKNKFKCAYCFTEFDLTHIELPDEITSLSAEELELCREGKHDYYKLMCDDCYMLLNAASAGSKTNAVH